MFCNIEHRHTFEIQRCFDPWYYLIVFLSKYILGFFLGYEGVLIPHIFFTLFYPKYIYKVREFLEYCDFDLKKQKKIDVF